ELLVETDRRVVADDFALNLLDGQVWLIADAFAAADAEKVVVSPAVAVGLLDDEASLAPSAPDRALEVVVMLAFPGAATVPQGEDALHAIEQLGRHDSGVATFVFLAFVGNVTEVV